MKSSLHNRRPSSLPRAEPSRPVGNAASAGASAAIARANSAAAARSARGGGGGPVGLPAEELRAGDGRRRRLEWQTRGEVLWPLQIIWPTSQRTRALARRAASWQRSGADRRSGAREGSQAAAGDGARSEEESLASRNLELVATTATAAPTITTTALPPFRDDQCGPRERERRQDQNQIPPERSNKPTRDRGTNKGNNNRDLKCQTKLTGEQESERVSERASAPKETDRELEPKAATRDPNNTLALTPLP